MRIPNKTPAQKRIWDKDLLEKAMSYGMLLIIFCVLTWFNASDFDWELNGEGGTVTMAMLAAVCGFLFNIRGKPSESRIKDLEKELAKLKEQL